MAAQASGLWKTKHAPPKSLQPSPTQRLLPDATSTSKGKTSLPPQTKTTAASLDYTHSPQKQCHSSTASTHLDHSSISPADSSSTSHSFNACRRWYRLRYEIRLNPIFTLDRTGPATTPTSYAHLSIQRSAIQSRASHSSPVSPITTARAIEQSQHQPCLHD